MNTLDKVKQDVGDRANNYTADQLQEISVTLDALAELFLDKYLSHSERPLDSTTTPTRADRRQ